MNESLLSRGQSRRIFSIPPSMLQAAVCDGIKDTTCTGNLGLIPGTLPILLSLRKYEYSQLGL